MGWTFERNLTVSSIWRTLTAGGFVIAAVVLLLWFGSFRGTAIVSADKPASLSECQQTGLASCNEAPRVGGSLTQETISSCFPGIPCLMTDTNQNGEQGTGTDGLSNGQTHAAIPDLDGQGTLQRCLTPGIPCYDTGGTTEIAGLETQ